MKLTADIENMGFRLADTNELDVDDYIRVKKIVYKKYIEEYFGEWNDEIEFNAFYGKRKLTFFKKLLLNNETVGFLNYDQKEDRFDNISVHIIEKAQNKGIGTLFLLNLIELAKEFGKPLFIEVVKSNPAQNLYRRLGFEIYKEDDVFYFLRYKYINTERNL